MCFKVFSIKDMNLSIKTEVRATTKSNSLLVINYYYLFITVLPLEKMY